MRNPPSGVGDAEHQEITIGLLDGWIPFSDAMPEPHRLLLVTNNLTARNAYGFASHVWLVGMVHTHANLTEFMGREIAQAGEITAFAEPGLMPLRFLTHWRYALPEEG